MRNCVFFIFLVIVCSTANAVDINDQAKSCSATIAKGGASLDLKQYQGKVVYLDFWATWCPPCKQSMPFLNALRNELKGQGFEIVAISVDENPDEARQFLQKYPVDYVTAMDPTGQCPKQYDVMAMPSAYILDRQGKVRYIHLGFRERDEKEIREYILNLLAEKSREVQS